MNFNNTELYAPQLIVGMGGSLLDPDLNTGLVPANGTLDPAAYTQSRRRVRDQPGERLGDRRDRVQDLRP